MIATARHVSVVLEARARRILVLSDALPERNGVGTYYRDLVDHLAGHLDRVELVCPDADAGWRNGWSFPMPGDPTQALCVPPLRRLFRHVRDMDPDVVIAATPGPFGLLGGYFARRHRAALICGFHTHLEGLTDLYWKAGPGRLFGGFSRWLVDAANRILFRGSQAVIANSPEMADMARTMGARRVRLVGTPLSQEFLGPPAGSASGRIRRVGFAGRLAPEKNIGQVIEAARRHREIEFVIAGDGPLRDSVARAQAALPNLAWLGWQPRESMRDMIDGVDMLVLPSSVESFGTIALEAMARERVAVVSQACGILGWPDLANGVFAMRRGERLADALERIVAMGPRCCRERAQAGRAAALRLGHANTRGWLDLISEVA
jgi:glycosyltransferase involved in cell wall biosynthesis